MIAWNNDLADRQERSVAKKKTYIFLIAWRNPTSVLEDDDGATMGTPSEGVRTATAKIYHIVISNTSWITFFLLLVRPKYTERYVIHY